MTGRELGKSATGFVCHVTAVVVGLALMFLGVAMGVTIVMLPVGIPLGFVGLGLCLWGFVGAAWEKAKPPGTLPPAG